MPLPNNSAAIRKVHAGRKVIAPDLAIASWGAVAEPLTERERQLLRLAGSGYSTVKIAQLIHLSEGTVRHYSSEAISKLQAKNRVEIASLARRASWLYFILP